MKEANKGELKKRILEGGSFDGTEGKGEGTEGRRGFIVPHVMLAWHVVRKWCPAPYTALPSFARCPHFSLDPNLHPTHLPSFFFLYYYQYQL